MRHIKKIRILIWRIFDEDFYKEFPRFFMIVETA